MARIFGIEIPNEKRIEASLPYIYGVGPSTAKRILEQAGVDSDIRTGQLTEEQLVKIAQVITSEGILIEGDLRLKTSGLRLAGHVKGRIYCEKGSVIVESTGVVDGGIEAEGRVIVDGQVGHQNNIENTGATRLIIRTPGLLAVLGNGKVYGNYHYGRIACYDDATIEGMGRKVRG